MDNLEKHIIKNKEEFNMHKADKAKMWDEISVALDAPDKKVIPLWRSPLFKMAMSLVLIVGIFSLIALNFINNNSQQNNFASQELQDIDVYYQGMVNTQIQLVKNNLNLSAKDKEEFLQFMDELDEEYNELKIDLKDNLDNELVLEAIISNYKKRIELMENLLHQINESKKITSDDNAYIL